LDSQHQASSVTKEDMQFIQLAYSFERTNGRRCLR